MKLYKKKPNKVIKKNSALQTHFEICWLFLATVFKVGGCAFIFWLFKSKARTLYKKINKNVIRWQKFNCGADLPSPSTWLESLIWETVISNIVWKAFILSYETLYGVMDYVNFRPNLSLETSSLVPDVMQYAVDMEYFINIMWALNSGSNPSTKIAWFSTFYVKQIVHDSPFLFPHCGKYYKVISTLQTLSAFLPQNFYYLIADVLFANFTLSTLCVEFLFDLLCKLWNINLSYFNFHGKF